MYGRLDTRALRKRILDAAVKSGAAHVAPAFSCMEAVAVLYGEIMRTDPKNPKWEDRDRFVMSKGHGCLAQYVVLEKLGFIPEDWLDNYCLPGSIMGGHATLGVPGVEASTGSLGHGLSMGVGMALAARFDKKDSRSFILMSDGECQEGSTWEAMMAASSFGLDNLIAVVDYNHFQSCGPVTEVLSSFEPFAKKWEAFGWSVVEIDGHNMNDLSKELKRVPFNKGKPSVVIANTVKGKGVSFMENVPVWHYRVPKGDEIAQAYKDIEKMTLLGDVS